MATASYPKINLISSQHIDGAGVYDMSGKEIVKIDRFMIDMVSGRVLYAVVNFRVSCACTLAIIQCRGPR